MTPTPSTKNGLPRTLNVTTFGLIILSGGVVTGGWRRLADIDDAAVLPFSMSGTIRIAWNPDGPGVLLGANDNGGGRLLQTGDTFTLEPAELQVQDIGGAPAIAVVGFHVSEADLNGTFTVGTGGPHAPIHPSGLGNDPDGVSPIALSNSVWLERGHALFRELTLRRSGPRVILEAAFDGAAVSVIDLNGGFCPADTAGARCEVHDNSRIVIGDTYAFAVHDNGAGLDVDWLQGAPDPYIVPSDRGLIIGDRSLAPRVRTDIASAGEADTDISLLGATHALYIKDGVLTVGSRPEVPQSPRGDEVAVYLAAQLAWEAWLRPDSTNCAGGWAWAPNRNPLAGGPCVDGSARRKDGTFKMPEGDYVRRLRRDKDVVLGVSKPREDVLDPLGEAEAKRQRGHLLDRYGTPLDTWKDGVDGLSGAFAVDPSVEALTGSRPIKEAKVKGGGTRASAPKNAPSGTGLEYVFDQLLVGRTEVEDPYAEFWRRWEGLPRLGGDDILLTIDLPLTRIVATALIHQADKIAAAARAQDGRNDKPGAAAQRREHRQCSQWDTSAVFTASAGDILAAVTVVSAIDTQTGAVSHFFETSKGLIDPDTGVLVRPFPPPGHVAQPDDGDHFDCLLPFAGPLRALDGPVLAGSTSKVTVYAVAADLALRGDAHVQFEMRDGDYWMHDFGDRKNGDGTYMLDVGVFTNFVGQTEVRADSNAACEDHGTAGVGLPIRFLYDFSHSVNAPACLIASAITLGGDRLGPALHAMQLDGPHDVLPPFGDSQLDAARFTVRTPMALGGSVDFMSGQTAILYDGVVTLQEAVKMPLGKGIWPTVIGLTGPVRMIGNQGVYTAPFLLRGVRRADGTELRITPDGGIQVVSAPAADMVKTAMLATVQWEGATASRGFEALRAKDPTRWAEIGVKTGTADLSGPPEHKAIVGLYPTSSTTPVSMAVWSRHASWLDDGVGINVVSEVVGSGALDQTDTKTDTKTAPAVSQPAGPVAAVR